MLKSWKDRRSWTVAEALASLGPSYVDHFVRDIGLPGGGEREFVRNAHMIAEPPADYTLAGYVSMLREDGPLWITLGDGLTAHALLLVGVYGSSVDDTKRAYGDAIFEFIDPITGGYVYRPALDFMTNFEREAAFIVDHRSNSIDLRWQIIHWDLAAIRNPVN